MNFCLKIKETNVFSFGESAIFCRDVTKKSLVTSKSFWRFVRSFLTNKNCHPQNNITLNDNGKLEKSSEEKPRNYQIY